MNKLHFLSYIILFIKIFAFINPYLSGVFLIFVQSMINTNLNL